MRKNTAAQKKNYNQNKYHRIFLNFLRHEISLGNQCQQKSFKRFASDYTLRHSDKKRYGATELLVAIQMRIKYLVAKEGMEFVKSINDSAVKETDQELVKEDRKAQEVAPALLALSDVVLFSPSASPSSSLTGDSGYADTSSGDEACPTRLSPSSQ